MNLLSQLFIFFTILAVFIACLGLFGLASYSVEQRTKEIGIRKVLGASAKGLVLKLTKEFTRWVLLANIIAWPLAWWLMDEWLKTFAYRIEIARFFWIFIVSGLVAFVIAILTVNVQAVRAANSDPVEAIKFE